MKRLLILLASILVSCVGIFIVDGPAEAQSNPGFTFGQVPTPGQWNSYFSNKMDYITPLAVGNVMTSNGSIWYSAPPATNGTVTSVGLSMPSIFTVTGSPVTASGTLTATYNSQTSNYVFAAPCGTNGTPVFRAICANDITAVNTPIYNTNTSAPASTAFVQSVVEAAQSNLPLNLGSTGGGTYSFDGTGTGLTVVYNTSGGAITSILTIANGGSGYKVGDLEQIIGTTGNNDAIVHVLTVSGTAVTSVEILYGGTGYTGVGAGGNSANFSSFLFYSLALTGTLTSNATFIVSYGSYLTTSSHGVCNNNTTGSFTVTVKQGNGSNTAIGTGVVCPQGTNNNSSILVQQDGVNDIWQTAPGLNGSSMNLVSLGAGTPGTGVFSTLKSNTSLTNADSSVINSSGYAANGVTGGAKGAGTVNATGLYVNGVAVTAGGVASSLSPGATVAGSTSLPGMVITNALEAADVIASAPASTTNFYFASGAVQYYTSNAANNFVLNFAWSSGTTFNSATSTPGVGATATGVLLVTQGSTAYYATSIQVDGTTTGVTTKWQGGTAPGSGNASGIDAYTCSIIKTAATPTYTAICGLTQF